MFKKDIILRRVTKPEDKLFISKLLDKAHQADKTRSVTHSDFLDPYQKALVEKALSEEEEIEYILNGGYSGAEREVMLFRPSFAYSEEDSLEFPFQVLNIRLLGRDALNHRDYLGSLMGLGIKREKIGDILVRDDGSSIIVMEEIADYIVYNLNKVGNVKVSVEAGDFEELAMYEPKVKEIKGTVASPRLDSVAGLGFGISRSKIADYIRAEKVNLNWETTSSLTKQVKEGDTISIRGKGRVEVEKLGGLTKKGRLSTVLKKYI